MELSVKYQYTYFLYPYTVEVSKYQKYILKLLDNSLKGKKDTYKKVWAIYAFLKWYEVFFLDYKIA